MDSAEPQGSTGQQGFISTAEILSVQEATLSERQLELLLLQADTNELGETAIFRLAFQLINTGPNFV